MFAESPPLPAGEYEIDVSGGTAVLVVNRSREWVPRRPMVGSGRVGSARAARTPQSGAREAAWLYALAIGTLAAEWLLRRRQGLR